MGLPADLVPGRTMEGKPIAEPKEREGSHPLAKKRRLSKGQGKRPGPLEDGEKRYVPPPKKRNTGVSFGEAHFAETSYYFEGGLRKVRPYYFDYSTYCKGRWVGKKLLDVFHSEFRGRPIEYYLAAAKAGRLLLNKHPLKDLGVVLKVRKPGVRRNAESSCLGPSPRGERPVGECGPRSEKKAKSGSERYRASPLASAFWSW